MIAELTDLPAGIIGFEGAGKLHAEEYRDVPLPASSAPRAPATYGSC